MNNTLRILAIDDNEGILNDYRKILGRTTGSDSLDDLESALFGETRPPVETVEFELITANQGQDGVRLFEEHFVSTGVDVVFVDMRMPPGWDGLQTIRAIWNIHPDQFVVLCSAYSDYSFVELRAALGNKPNFLILNKPFSADEILQVVHSVGSRESAESRRGRLLAAELKRAIDEGQLSVVFQPLIDLTTGTTVAFETLCRWIVDGKVVAYPDQFVSLAEKYGLIAELGEYVVGEAVQMAKALLPGWKNRKFPLVTVNASPKQLDDNFIAHVEYLVQKAQLPPEALGIEVTESGEITGDATCIPTIETLQTLGFHILLDDFGAGHSCLANIAQVPFDTVKLDRSFCMSLPSCESSALLLDAVSKLLRQLGKQALVEGVETAVQEAMMKEFQYDFAQGYYYSKPISPETALELFFQDTDASARQAA